MGQITVILADDHQIVREGLRVLLESEGFAVIAETGDGLKVPELVLTAAPDVLLLDLLMPGLPGLEITQRVAQVAPKTRIVIYSMQRDDHSVIGALRSGAAGYILKDGPVTEVPQAIRTVLEAPGRPYLSPSLQDRGLEDQAKTPTAPFDVYETLTKREREVLQLIAESRSNPQIAEALGISPRTAESHRANVFRKLGCRHQTDVIRYALRRGLLPRS